MSRCRRKEVAQVRVESHRRAVDVLHQAHGGLGRSEERVLVHL